MNQSLGRFGGIGDRDSHPSEEVDIAQESSMSVHVIACIDPSNQPNLIYQYMYHLGVVVVVATPVHRKPLSTK